MRHKKSSVIAQIQKEHDCFKRDMNDILDEAAREIRTADFADWRLEFMWRLRDFKNHLLKHFDLEEEGGFIDDVLAEKPEATILVKKLEVEHVQIIAILDRLLDELKLMELHNIARLNNIREDVVELISTIRAHEAAENELIQDVYYQEYGYPS